MTTILLINACSSLLAAAGICGLLIRQELRARRDTIVRPLYVTTHTTHQR